MGTHTAIVGPDGTVQVLVDEARPGETVVVTIERATHPIAPPDVDRRRSTPTNADQHEELTVRTADTPEKKERLIQRWLEIGRANRGRLTPEQLDDLNGEWLYDENGLPK